MSVKQLAQLAVAANAMTSGLAEHADIDEVYWTAFWRAARKLADDPSKEAEWALARVARMSGIDDGGDLLVCANYWRDRRSADKHQHPKTPASRG